MRERWIALLSVVVLGAATLARADQCQVVDQAVADRAIAAIRASHGRLLAHCAPCSDPAPQLSAAFVPSDVRFVGDAVQVDGQEVDLAYLYLEIAPNLFENIALRTGCEAIEVPQAFRFVGGTARAERFGAPPASLAALGWGRPLSTRVRPLPPG